MMSRLFPHPKYTGVTWIEIVVLIVMAGILGAVTLTAFKGMDEHRDAEAVINTQATLQSIVTQGATRLDIRPSDFKPGQFSAVLVAAKEVLRNRNSPPAVVLSANGRNFNLKIPATNRGAGFTVNPNGVVELDTIDGFSDYRVDSLSKSLVKK